MINITTICFIILSATFIYAIFAELAKERKKHIIDHALKVIIVSASIILVLFLALRQEIYSKSFSSSEVYRLKYFLESETKYQYAYFDDSGQLIEKSVPVELYPPGLEKIGPTIVEVFNTATMERSEWGPFYAETKKIEKPIIMFFKYPSSD